MATSLTPLIDKIDAGNSLTRAESKRAFTRIMKGDANDDEIEGFLLALKKKGETADEITGAVEVLRKLAKPIKAPADAIDTCGTGGDAKGTYNISTASALVVAACGIPVAKHGNRSVSSKSGSADVLEALGINIMAEKHVLEQCLKKANICFMMATQFHDAMKHVAPIRKKLKTRTIFNVLGPLINPARTQRQLLGVYDKSLIDSIVRVLKLLNMEHAWVVHGEDGLDELTITGQSYVASLNKGRIKTFSVTPEDAGLARAQLKDIQGGDAQTNAEAIKALLYGEQGAYRDAVLLNSAASLIIAGTADTLKDGVREAKLAIDSGRARNTLKELIHWSNQS